MKLLSELNFFPDTSPSNFYISKPIRLNHESYNPRKRQFYRSCEWALEDAQFYFLIFNKDKFEKFIIITSYSILVKFCDDYCIINRLFRHNIRIERDGEFLPSSNPLYNQPDEVIFQKFLSSRDIYEFVPELERSSCVIS